MPIHQRTVLPDVDPTPMLDTLERVRMFDRSLIGVALNFNRIEHAIHFNRLTRLPGGHASFRAANGQRPHPAQR
jgi:hypothetical protein